MDYRQLGHSGVRVSVIGLGTNRFGSKDVPQTEVDRIIDTAVDQGVNFIDTANVYNDGRSEEMLGHALQGRMNKVVLATKFSFPKKQGPNTWGASRYQLMQAVEASCAGCKTITSIFTILIGGTTRRPSTRHSVRWTTWFAWAKCATSVHRPMPPGSWPTQTPRQSCAVGLGLSLFNPNIICCAGAWSVRFCLTAEPITSASFPTILWQAAF